MPQSWSADRAVLRLQAGGFAVVDRPSGRTTMHVPSTPSPEAYAHPFLGATAAVLANWRGGTSFHGSAFRLGDGVWGVLGEREDGKSTTVAWLAANDVAVVADDLIVLARTTVLAGPRCIDLRESAHERFGLGDDIGVVGTRRRWRFGLPPIAAEAPLLGWIVLKWADEVEVRQVPTPERFLRLAASRGLRLTEADPRQWTDLIALPMVELSRPMMWSRLDEAMATLLTAIRQ